MRRRDRTKKIMNRYQKPNNIEGTVFVKSSPKEMIESKSDVDLFPAKRKSPMSIQFNKSINIPGIMNRKYRIL